jgi:hypothetical protein
MGGGGLKVMLNNVQALDLHCMYSPGPTDAQADTDERRQLIDCCIDLLGNLWIKTWYRHHVHIFTLVDTANKSCTEQYRQTLHSKALAKQVIGKGIRVNAVAPGPLWTPLQPSGDCGFFGGKPPCYIGCL